MHVCAYMCMSVCIDVSECEHAYHQPSNSVSLFSANPLLTDLLVAPSVSFISSKCSLISSDSANKEIKNIEPSITQKCFHLTINFYEGR